MSAIAGICNLNMEPITIEHRNSIMKSLEKYPADDIQTWTDDNVFLGCHAQWITPESVGEKLPYYDNIRKLAITADAIIDNREELFERLQIKEEHRKNMPDSKLILLSYHKWGEECPAYLIGDFAFMIWDDRKKQLFGARDPSGYRTLYYYRNYSRFAFCTTIEPLLTLPYIKKQLNEEWLAEFLAIIGVVDTLDACTTPYKNIDQIPPFHSILVSKDKFKLQKYGSFKSINQLKLKSDGEYVEAFQEVFQQAVTSRLRTHHKVGSQLSGGLDSGSVVGFAARVLKEEKKTLHTFSYIPPKDFVDYTPKHLLPDERPFIKQTVGYVGGIKAHYCDFEGTNSYMEIDDLLDMMEMPYKFIENSFWLKGTFEKAHTEGVGVLLSGSRGNLTVSWGSPMDYYATLLKNLKWIHLHKELKQYINLVGGSRKRILPFIAKTAFPFINRILDKSMLEKPPMLINPDFAARTEIFNKLNKYGMDETGWFATPNIFKHRIDVFGNMYSFNAGNTMDSKLSLRYSLWRRDPTSDLRVIRFCLSVPEEQYVQNGLDRALIRRATENILPDKVRLNQHIRGVQAADWIHRMVPSWDTFINEAKQMIESQRGIFEFINDELIRSALAKVEEGPQPGYSLSDASLLMRSLIIYRFMKKFT